MNAHTAGPWRYADIRSEGRNDHFRIESANGSTIIGGIYECWDGNAGTNARLIAAAPELLDALDNLTRAANVDEPDALQMFVAIEHGRAILDKVQS